MHHHLEEGDCRYPHILKVIGISFPGLGITDFLLLLGIIRIEGVALGIDQFDIVIELCNCLGLAGVRMPRGLSYTHPSSCRRYP